MSTQKRVQKRIIHKEPRIIAVDPSLDHVVFMLEYAPQGYGKFIITAKGSSVRLHALIFAKDEMTAMNKVSHNELPEILFCLNEQRLDGIIIGGGMISVAMPERALRLYSISGYFGNVPLDMLEATAKLLTAWDVESSGDQLKAVSRLGDQSKVIKWFFERGRAIQFMGETDIYRPPEYV